MRQHSLTNSMESYIQSELFLSSLIMQALSIKIKVLPSDKGVLLNLTPTWSCQSRAYCLRILQRQIWPLLPTKSTTPEITVSITATVVLKWHHNRATTCRSVRSPKSYSRILRLVNQTISQESCLVSMRFRPQHYKTTLIKIGGIPTSDLSFFLEPLAIPKSISVSCFVCEVSIPLKLIIRT
jgi:hypothetical protein